MGIVSTACNDSFYLLIDCIFLQSINISWTKLGYTRPTLFKKLNSLKFLDLRWNKLDHMEGPLILPVKFENLYLAGNNFSPIKIKRKLKIIN